MFGIAAALLVFDHLRRGFGHFNLGTHLLDLGPLVFELSRQCINPFFLFLHFAVFFEGRGLGHNRQGEIVAVAACVARLEVIAVAGEDRAVRQVTECAENRVGRCVVNHSEHCTRCQRAGASIDKSKRHVAVNGHADGGNFRGFSPSAVQHAFVGRERVEGQRVIDGQSAGAGGTVPGQQDCSRSGSGSDCHCAVDFARAAKRAGVNLHRASARGGAGFISNQERAFGDGSTPSVGVSVAQGQLAIARFGERAARTATDSAILDQPGKIRAQVVRAHG